MQNPEDIWHQTLINLLTLIVATLPWEIQKSHFQQYYKYVLMNVLIICINSEAKKLNRDCVTTWMAVKQRHSKCSNWTPSAWTYASSRIVHHALLQYMDSHNQCGTFGSSAWHNNPNHNQNPNPKPNQKPNVNHDAPTPLLLSIPKIALRPVVKLWWNVEKRRSPSILGGRTPFP